MTTKTKMFKSGATLVSVGELMRYWLTSDWVMLRGTPIHRKVLDKMTLETVNNLVIGGLITEALKEG